MTDIVSIALTGFFVWSGLGIAATTTPVAVPAAISVPEKTLTVKLTAYNAVPEQTDSNPMVTASGAWTNPEVIAARSRDLASDLPFGTIIAIESPAKSNSCGFGSVAHLIGYRVIADTMHERMRNKIDIVLDAEDTVMIGVNGQPRKATNPARALGICTVKARVVGRIPVKDIPETQSELALMVRGALASK
ncbi:hypothetical protein A2765_03480 [Candidatus Kaiserbacteria bacterium RIFCSPHIGHO2_01_FULL_56_24]|uniref:Uncharacterized protein n=1 Tax=Candidatus Kaiserbacteria bacterium RIFCSPHIGHO2_01_FULL_56_24 TaxID=1798487 RepID=A0A1F6DHY2_9BACT|nr:MAG: hypothetical protein A2765_03480 [Candidatus Kaiserbacteria bacterium RIFCSPHIGHO2_01_FULL_56_24]